MLKQRPVLLHPKINRLKRYILGFRIDPVERMREVFKEIHSLWQLFSVNPVFGVDWKMEERPEALAKARFLGPVLLGTLPLCGIHLLFCVRVGGCVRCSEPLLRSFRRAQVTVARQDDDVEIVDAAGRDNVAAYYAEGACEGALLLSLAAATVGHAERALRLVSSAAQRCVFFGTCS